MQYIKARIGVYCIYVNNISTLKNVTCIEECLFNFEIHCVHCDFSEMRGMLVEKNKQ